MPYKIQIVTLPTEGMKGSYMVNLLCDIWRREGHDIAVGSVDRLEADIGILHIDRTWVQEGSLPENLHSRPLLNSKALDISKRHVSELIIDREDEYAGPVIIKTDANHFGLRDKEGGRLSTLLRLQHQRLARRISWQMARQLVPGEYPILEYKEQVPNWVWKREELIVEKFTPEIEGDLYVLRLWLFFGDREYGVKMWSKKPVVKRADIVRYEYIDDVPDEIRGMRATLGFDFGKFDYVMVDGKPILIDANKTPWITPSSNSPTPNMLNLAEGLHSYIRMHS